MLSALKVSQQGSFLNESPTPKDPACSEFTQKNVPSKLIQYDFIWTILFYLNKYNGISNKFQELKTTL